VASNSNAYCTAEDTLLSVTAANGLLVGATDVDGDALTVTSVIVPMSTAKIVSFSPDGAFVYQPVANYNGLDWISFTISDGQGGTAFGTTTVNIGM